MRTFAFLQCGCCKNFQPKSAALAAGHGLGPAFQTAAFVGVCRAAVPPEWLVWKSIEAAASLATSCADRTPVETDPPLCTLHDFTPESGTKSYPKNCVYYSLPSCPFQDEGPGAPK